ncbi:hypothetical protein [Streptomyces albipurpureus]|uniref:Integral membrane protein n=1 Tax=Streptomyces albipurpureus TaxID=2897419 RepID=A0ABT0V1E4_9ACTN|nr:hypothetical protein [Streptomyces sp. CWNU-1]MCM2394014.1 hypothetical protein [Streptomyces sp. CWNU-1]
MKNEIILTIGWVAAIQGVLGAAGQIFGDDPWGLLHLWWNIPVGGYLAIFLVGAAIAFMGETTRRRERG